MRITGLKVTLSKEELWNLMNQYHYNDTDFDEIKKIYNEITNKITTNIYYEKVVEGKEYAVIVTLGEMLDEWQSSYLKRELLKEAYMIECISLELLKKAYEGIEKVLHQETNLWVEKYHFIGDESPLSKLEEIFKLLKQSEVTYNEAYMLKPLKSVVFTVSMALNRTQGNCNICESCSLKTCQNRNNKKVLSYGYQRILGKPIL